MHITIITKQIVKTYPYIQQDCNLLSTIFKLHYILSYEVVAAVILLNMYNFPVMTGSIPQPPQTATNHATIS